MKRILAAFVVMTALGLSGAGAVAGAPSSPISAVSANQTTLPPLGIFDSIFDFIDGILDGLQKIIERIDQFLEAVVNLLETLQDLFGGGG